MNDFTKDELEELYFFILLHKNKYRVNYPTELLNKIQSMIENYCEYENILEYVSNKIIEKHKTCLIDQFDNGYFWAMKELQEFILKRIK